MLVNIHSAVSTIFGNPRCGLKSSLRKHPFLLRSSPLGTLTDAFAGYLKRAMGLTSTSHLHHPFLNFSLPSLQDYDVKLTNFPFCGRRKHKTTTSFFLSWTSVQFFRIQLERNLLLLDLVFSFQIWYFWKWIPFASIGQSKHMSYTFQSRLMSFW